MVALLMEVVMTQHERTQWLNKVVKIAERLGVEDIEPHEFAYFHRAMERGETPKVATRKMGWHNEA